MSEVVRLRDNSVMRHPGNPDADVIRELETLLERAKAGKIIGVAWAHCYFDGTSGGHFVGEATRSQVGQLFSIMTKLTRQLNE